MSKFLRLLRKDLEASRWPLGILSGLILLFMLFVRYKISAGWALESAIITVALPLMFFVPWFVWQSFQTLRSEWKEDTVYTLLVLPVPGWYITLAKLVGLFVEYTILLAVTLGGASLILGRVLLEFTPTAPIAWIIRNGLIVYLISLGILASVVIFIQLAFVVSKMVGRFQGLVALWVLILTNWLVGQMGMLLEPVFRWVPPIPLERVFRLDQVGLELQRFDYHLAPKIGTWLGTILLFILTAWLMERYVEIND